MAHPPGDCQARSRRPARDKLNSMLGPTLMVLALVIVLPMTTLILAALASMAFGGSLGHNSRVRHTDHELEALNR